MKLRLSMFALAVTLWAAPAFAQGCAMCYRSGAPFPPVGVVASIVGLAFRYGSSRDEQ